MGPKRKQRHEPIRGRTKSGLFHSVATSRWKQIQFGEANVQLTFHENEKNTIGDVDCVMFELDIDYHQDVGAHILLEVITTTSPTR